MQMIQFPAVRQKFGVKLAILVGVVMAVMLHVPTASAQSIKGTSFGAIRIGGYFPINSSTRSTFGNAFPGGGLDYSFQTNGVSERDQVSVDYIEYSHGSNDIRLIPVTIGQQTISGPRGEGVRPYAGYGVGAYFVHIKNPGNNNFGGSDTKNSISVGGFLNVGLDLTNNFFIDARYHIVSPTTNVNTDALQATVGLRF